MDEREHCGHESDLAQLHADVKGEQGHRNVVGGNSDPREYSGESESVQQAEGEGYQPGLAVGETLHAAPVLGQVRRQKDDAQRDYGFDGSGREVDDAERRERQSDRVRDGERRDLLSSMRTPGTISNKPRTKRR